MIEFVRRHETAVFFVGILTANFLFVLAIQMDLLPQSVLGFGRFYLLGAVLIAVVLIARGLGGVLDLLQPMVVWRVNLGWYLFAIFWAAVVCVLALGIRYVLGDGPIEPSDFGHRFLFRKSTLLSIFVSALIGEIVWISYALRKVSPKLGYLGAAHLIGFVWSLWWLPMIILNIGVVPDIPLGALVANQCGIALMCAFLYRNTKSGLLIFVMQFAFNSSVLLFPVNPGCCGVNIYWTFALLYYSLALLLVIGSTVMGKRNPGRQAISEI